MKDLKIFEDLKDSCISARSLHRSCLFWALVWRCRVVQSGFFVAVSAGANPFVAIPCLLINTYCAIVLFLSLCFAENFDADFDVARNALLASNKVKSGKGECEVLL